MALQGLGLSKTGMSPARRGSPGSSIALKAGRPVTRGGLLVRLAVRPNPPWLRNGINPLSRGCRVPWLNGWGQNWRHQAQMLCKRLVVTTVFTNTSQILSSRSYLYFILFAIIDLLPGSIPAKRRLSFSGCILQFVQCKIGHCEGVGRGPAPQSYLGRRRAHHWMRFASWTGHYKRPPL